MIQMFKQLVPRSNPGGTTKHVVKMNGSEEDSDDNSDDSDADMDDADDDVDGYRSQDA